jgi:hypothetical protein
MAERKSYRCHSIPGLKGLLVLEATLNPLGTFKLSCAEIIFIGVVKGGTSTGNTYI